MFLLTSKDVPTRHFQTFAAHFRQTSKSADLTNDTAVTFLNEVPEDSIGTRPTTLEPFTTVTANRKLATLQQLHVARAAWPAYTSMCMVSLCGHGQFGTDF